MARSQIFIKCLLAPTQTLSIDVFFTGGRTIRKTIQGGQQIEVSATASIDELNQNAQIQALIAAGKISVTPVIGADDVVGSALAASKPTNSVRRAKWAARGAIALSGFPALDGLGSVPAAGDVVLAAGQGGAYPPAVASAANGLYVASAGAWSRASDAGAGNLPPNTIVTVEAGLDASTAWFLTTGGPITVGTTPLAFSQFPLLTDLLTMRQLAVTARADFGAGAAYGAGEPSAAGVSIDALGNVRLDGFTVVGSSANGAVLRAPNGTYYAVTATNAGALVLNSLGTTPP